MSFLCNLLYIDSLIVRKIINFSGKVDFLFCFKTYCKYFYRRIRDNYLIETFENWRGKLEQIDDVLVMGVKI